MNKKIMFIPILFLFSMKCFSNASCSNLTQDACTQVPAQVEKMGAPNNCTYTYTCKWNGSSCYSNCSVKGGNCPACPLPN